MHLPHRAHAALAAAQQLDLQGAGRRVPARMHPRAQHHTGGQGGNITSAAFFFAPAGGTVSDFVASNGQKIQIKTYNGLELGFMDRFALKPDIPIVITYNVTTAPGVETPLTFSKTPTAQDYHEFYGVG